MSYENAKALYEAKDYAGAEVALRELVSQDAGTAENWRLLAHALANQQKIDEAIDAARKAIEIQPAYAESRYTLGYVLGAQKKWLEATAELESALALDPMHQSAKQGLVFSLVQLGQEQAPVDMVAAEKTLRRAVEVDSHNPHAISALLNFLVAVKKTRDAENVVSSISNDLRMHPVIKPIVDKLGQSLAPVASVPTIDPAASSARSQAGPAPYVDPAGVIRPQDNPHSGQLTAANIPCPHCGLPINHIVIMCPHCNRQVRQSSVFAGRDTGPDFIWQEVALTVIGVIWSLFSLLIIVGGIAGGPIGMVAVFFGLMGLLMGLGFIFKWDIVLGVAKWLLILNLMGACLGLVLASGMKDWLMVGIQVFRGALVGFTLYLVNYNSDY